MAVALTGKADPFDICRTASGLSATDWTPVTFDPWVRVVRVKNAGTGVLSVGRANSGAHGASDHQTTIAAGASQDFRIAAGASKAPSPGLAVFGADGANHPIEWVLSRGGTGS